MKFRYDGKEYRIVFRYDRPRDLSAHEGHRLEVCENINSGKPTIGCVDCLWPDGSPLQLYPIGKYQRSRNTYVSIQGRIWDNSWVTTIDGIGKVNVKSGDVFKRSAGREAALVNAIGRPGGPKVLDRTSFEFSAWASFYLRRPNHKAIMDLAGIIA